jgi:hypothetical protein
LRGLLAESHTGGRPVYKHNFNISVKSLTTICSIVLFSALFLLVNSSTVLAVGLGVSPAKLYFEPIRGNEEGNAQLTVMNTDDTATRYRVYVRDADYRDCFDIEPSEFILQPGKNKSVSVRYCPSNDMPVLEKGYICIVTLPADGGLKIGAGIRVPVFFND